MAISICLEWRPSDDADGDIEASLVADGLGICDLVVSPDVDEDWCTWSVHAGNEYLNGSERGVEDAQRAAEAAARRVLMIALKTLQCCEEFGTGSGQHSDECEACP